ncbi:L-threonylcarbamoyladenylate synthase [Iamia sp.]|uniref:L-threonylcarbamoyladenylate synthase n=1 Tax=Iamia sp. TaxID=2722710 RepID=UPI002BEC0B56|nr:L-threonylcarbamoyladenylate synthase [Iamia sp.]HXH56352.1 L-threonylcarbamoyladenylate synthase [Iamia sp.]
MTTHATDGAEADPGLVDRLCSALLAGEPVVMPTDTVYGLAILPGVPGATARLFALKDRRPDTPLAVLVADADAARTLSRPLGPEVDRIVERLWPGALTLVLPRAAPVAVWDLGADPRTIGVRCPDHALVRAVARRVGPVATTSANRHGEPTPSTAAEAAATLTGPVAMVADGGPLRGAASTVVDVTGPGWTLLREGPVDIAAVHAAAQGQ